ncbi:MAG: cytochrome C oxidase subunit IV family protein [Mariniblastus sp.]|nr:cytochrome C oxidase subunit IV family protein [Mariniblastus sp.]
MIETKSVDRDPSEKSNTKVFVLVFLMLCVLTALSFWVANSYLMENKVVGWAAMMMVSVAKAMLVILFFMHLWWERAWKYVLTIPALFMGLLLVLLLVPDVGYRYLTYSKDRRENAPEPVVSELTEGDSVIPISD